jgi:hypothetical protein
MTDEQKDKVLEKLEHMLESLPEKSRPPILDLINKRKVELGIQKSELLPAGYKLKRTKTKPRPQTIESKESLRKIAMGVGLIPELKHPIPQDLDVKDEPLKKEKKAIEEADSYKY